MTDQAEHRGWEIENSYHPHFLDDAEWDVAADSESSEGRLWGFAILTAVLIVGTYLGGKWLEPPVVRFPVPQIVTVAGPRVEVAIHDRDFLFPPGYVLTCIEIDGKAMTVKPNWRNPNCKGSR